MARILLLNGPNLNLLGSREPGIYGSATLSSIEKKLKEAARARGHELIAVQSNAEHELIDKVQSGRPTASTSSSSTPVPMRIPASHCATPSSESPWPFIEVHLTNIHAREEFRHHSYLSGIAVGSIVGLGAQGYELALEAACTRLAAT